MRDLPHCINDEALQFADDITESATSDSLKNVKERLTESYTRTKEFCSEVGLNMNPSKTQFIIIKAPNKKLDDEEAIILDGVRIEALKAVKLLGFSIDRHLTYAEHINNTVTKCQGLLGVMRKSAKMLPRKLLLLMYTAIVRSHLEYCSAVFGSAAQTHLKKLDVIQKIAARIICEAPSDAHSAPLLECLGLKSLGERRKNHILDIVRKGLNNECHPDICNMFESAEDGSLHIPHLPRTAVGRRSFSYFAALIYNEFLNN